jgi:hypothetical protein
MIAVAIAGFLIGMGIEGERRREQFEALTSLQRKKLLILVVDVYHNEGIEKYSELDKKKYEYYHVMHRKYDWAARYPWFPVWPDPADPIEADP